MATSEQVRAFISKVAPTIKSEAEKRGYKYPSAIIAQACCESGYGTSSLAKVHNFFGMKCGKSWKGDRVSKATKEEYTKGVLTSITADFRAYPNLEAGIKGYFDFISATRYSNLKKATSPKDYLQKIKDDGYCTSSTYVKTCYAIIQNLNLTQFDADEPAPKYFPQYKGTTVSIVDALRSLSINSAFSYRSKIAKVNSIGGYIGTAKQNTELLRLLKNGKLKRP